MAGGITELNNALRQLLSGVKLFGGATTAAEALANLGGISEKVIYTNASPSSSVPSTYLWNGDVTDYDYFEVTCLIKAGSNREETRRLYPGKDILVAYPGNFEENFALHEWGRIFYTDSTGIACGPGKDQAFNATTANTANNVMIPYKITAVKGVK